MDFSQKSLRTGAKYLISISTYTKFKLFVSGFMLCFLMSAKEEVSHIHAPLYSAAGQSC